MIRRIALIAALCLLPHLTTAHAEEPPYVQHENLVFAEVHGTGLLADVFTPLPSETPRPGDGLAIVDVASGAFYSDRGKINDHKKARMFDIYCGAGYTVFAIRPGSITKYSGEEMNAHVKLGIRWVKSQAEKYGVDPDRLGITGASAGGYLATMAAVTPEDATGDGPLGQYDTRVRAAAVFFPPTDFTRVEWASGRGGRLERFFFSDGFGDRPKEEIAGKVNELSPAHRVGDSAPPMLFIHGDADEVVKLEQSEIMVEALKAKGHEAELIVKEGGAHPWPTIYEEVAVMCAWFNEALRRD